MNEPSTPLSSPICAELRSKKYYFLDHAATESAELLDASNDCWCARTRDRVGPDHEFAHPDDCRAPRACFRSLYAAPSEHAAQEDRA